MTLRPSFLLLLFAAHLALAQNTRPAPQQPAADKKFTDILAEVRTLLSQQQSQQALDKLREAEALKPDHWAVWNARGNIYTSARDFGKARDSYKQAAALNPDGFETRFNLAELDYVEGNYEAAIGSFNKLLTSQPKLPAQIRNLIEFKLFACEMKLNRMAEAEAMMKDAAFSDQSPASYFAKAVLALHKGDQPAASEWLAKAERMFKPGEIEPYLDALIEARWITLKPRTEPKK